VLENRGSGVTSTVLGCGDDGEGRGAGADVEQRAQHAGRRAGHVVDGEAHHQQPHPLCSASATATWTAPVSF
jgi:hypothetical protein